MLFGLPLLGMPAPGLEPPDASRTLYMVRVLEHPVVARPGPVKASD